MLKLNPYCIFLITIFFTCTVGKANTPAQKKTSQLKNFTIVQDSLDVSKKEDILYFSVRAYSQEGLKSIMIRFCSPSGTQQKEEEFLVGRNLQEKLVIGSIHFSKKSEAGLWTIQHIIIEDSNGFQEIINYELLKQLDYPSSLYIEGK